MSAPLKTIDGTSDVAATMAGIGRRAKAAARVLALASTEQKDGALTAMAQAVRAAKADILAANAEDIADAKSSGATPAFIDRLALDDTRIAAMADGLEVVRAQPDPVGKVTESWTRPNGMTIERIRVPLGVIAVIYESRPNVTADAGALALKAGNAVILRGGSDGHRSARAIHVALAKGLKDAGLPEDAISLVPTRDRAAVGQLLQGLDGAIDVIVPRGGKSLVARVQAEARVPVFAHLEGVCHVYVDKAAKLDMAKSIVLNAKLRRTGVCGAAETLLVDRAAAATHLKPLIGMLLDAGCEVRGDAAVQGADGRVKPASEEDWSTEYLDTIITAGVVDGVDAAIGHIERYGSHHTDAIVTEDGRTAEKFLNEVDSAIVLHNASTQFADGGEFGFGAEIGIATGKLHARGPVGVEQLTSFKYRVRGTGQIRP
jgi:glutamate-5-semialdehyde dehydrogenase